jgi:hypothetical protein
MAEMNFKIKYESTSQMEIDWDEKHQDDCVYLLKASSPIIECELHECGLSSKPRLAVVKKQAPTDIAEKFPAGEPLGLCINCANLRDCMLPKHEGGVWHCEEYS